MKHKRVLSLVLALVLCLTLLPAAAMAEEEHLDSFTITFDANEGEFPGGSKTVERKTLWMGAGNNITEMPPIPERSGYVFDSWDVNGSSVDYSPIGNVNFTADATVKANWRVNSNNAEYPLNANGGTVSPDTYMLDENHMIVGKLPTPTRSGYTFTGWYIDGKLVDESKPVTSTAPLPVAQWRRTSKVTPSVTASPAKVEAGTEKIEIVLSCTGGAALDWRPLERLIYTGGSKPANLSPVIKSYLSGNFDAVGLTLTDVMYHGDWDFNSLDDNAYPSSLYPDGVCPTNELSLTLEGAAKTGTLTINLSGGLFVQPVSKSENIVLTESSAEIFNSAKVSVPVGSGSANGPFTVKFDLNYKDKSKVKFTDIPKAQEIQKDGRVDLPDGSKLTPPSDAVYFYAWCIKTKNAKGEDELFPWGEEDLVKSDMTLYAGWVRKGKVVIDGQPLEADAETSAEKPAETKPAETAKPSASKFTDVAATSAFAPAISWAVEKGITNGTTPTTFEPGKTCTRAQIVTFLWRAAGSPEPKSTEAEYADVTNTGAYYYKAVQWAAEMGMEESGTFRPDAPCTRGQAVYFIWKANDSNASAGSAPSFTDLPKDSLYYDAVLWAVGRGVTNGTGDGTTFSPDATCTRGQIVTFLYRAYEQ